MLSLDLSLKIFLSSVLGLLVGSFFNVLIYRWPRMLMQQWDEEVQAYAQRDAEAPLPAGSAEKLNLAFPASHCPHCQHSLRWYENIPVFSFVRQGGRCTSCAARIGWQYPCIELLAGGIFLAVTVRWGWSATALVWGLFLSMLLVLAAVDWQTQLLPDQGTQPLLWGGLLASLMGWTGVAIGDAVTGAIVGYLILWGIANLFKLVTGQDGMGQGDLKLLAALGAWLGWPVLPGVVVLASFAAAVIGWRLRASGRYMAFGPYLCAGAVLAWAQPSWLTLP